MKVLGIITVRGGSKAIPDKNIAVVGGKPLLAWTVIAARKSAKIDRIIVTTDSPKIAEVAKEFGAEVPFLRPSDLAKDDTPSIDPIIHAVKWLFVQEDYQPDYVMCLQPTSLFRTADDIDSAINLAQEKKAAAVVSVVLPEHNPYWMKSISSDGRLQNFLPGKIQFTRRQDLPPTFALNGAIYLVKREILIQENTLNPENSYPYVMPPERSLDIDSPWDLYISDLIISNQNKK